MANQIDCLNASNQVFGKGNTDLTSQKISL